MTSKFHRIEIPELFGNSSIFYAKAGVLDVKRGISKKFEPM
jgi:hypothetical protein